MNISLAMEAKSDNLFAMSANGAALLEAIVAWQAANPGDADPDSWNIYAEMKNDPINLVTDPWETI